MPGDAEGREVVEEYRIDDLTKVVIVRVPHSIYGILQYNVVGPKLDEVESRVVDYVRRWFIEKYPKPLLDMSKLSVVVDEAVSKFGPKLLRKWGKKEVTDESIARIKYIARREIVGFGKLEPLLRDPNIEDIHVLGIGKPVYVWHRLYENLPTNIFFLNPRDLERHLQKMMLTTGKFVSLSRPIVDGKLPMGYRINVVHSVISELGTAITIRKHREVPFNIVDLIKLGTITPELAGLLWVALENKRSVFIVGETAAGKSFPGDTLIVIRMNGKVRVTSVEGLYSSIDVNESEVGEHLVKDVRALGMETLSVGPDLRVRWVKIKSLIRHWDSRNLVKVRTPTSITVTSIDHNFIKLDERARLTTVEASELRVGDHLVNAWVKGIDFNRNPLPMNYIEHLAETILQTTASSTPDDVVTKDDLPAKMLELALSDESSVKHFARSLLRALNQEGMTQLSLSRELIPAVDLVFKRLGIPARVKEYSNNYTIMVNPSKALEMLNGWNSPLRHHPFDSVSDPQNRVLDGTEIFLEPVEEISYTPSKGWLYDIEVEGTHNFLIGQVGWRVNHNTTLLNAVATLIPLTMKLSIIEEVREINLPHPNVVYMVSREGVDTLGNVTLFDLVKTSLRQRPDYIIVGEIRGEEACVLLQAISLGHGGISTMHAEGAEAAVRRLMAPPMNVPPYMISLLDLIIHVTKLRLKEGVRRYVMSASEVREIDPRTKEPELNVVYKSAVSDLGTVYIDRFRPEDSITLRRITQIRGLSFNTLVEKVRRRAEFLKELSKKNPTYDEVILEISKYSD
jgi:type IV secretory pathway ATPase VirB11/archaellum biosynthesis ATPase